MSLHKAPPFPSMSLEIHRLTQLLVKNGMGTIDSQLQWVGRAARHSPSFIKTFLNVKTFGNSHVATVTTNPSWHPGGEFCGFHAFLSKSVLTLGFSIQPKPCKIANFQSLTQSIPLTWDGKKLARGPLPPLQCPW